MNGCASLLAPKCAVYLCVCVCVCVFVCDIKSEQSLKWTFCLCRSIDRNDIDTGGQATYHDGHKIAFSLWPKWIITVECGILTIKKNYVKTLQIGLHSVILNKSIKNTYNKKKTKFDCKRKITLFYLDFSSIATFKKQKLFSVNFVSWDYMYFG